MRFLNNPTVQVNKMNHNGNFTHISIRKIRGMEDVNTIVAITLLDRLNISKAWNIICNKYRQGTTRIKKFIISILPSLRWIIHHLLNVDFNKRLHHGD